MMKMKPKIRNLKDIQREKQKILREIGIQEYALEFNLLQIKKKLSFVTLTAYLLDLAMEQLESKTPSILSRLLKGLLERFFSRK
jgi:hypothetical protein